MAGNVRGYTPNYGFRLVNFDTPRWHTLEYANWQQLDALLDSAGILSIRGAWQNDTLYTTGDRVADPDTGELFRAAITHTSPATGTFEEARIANPTHWVLLLGGVPIFTGAWATGVNYNIGDIVVHNTYDYYLCTIPHLSAGVIDPVKFQTIFLASNVVLDTQAAAAAAATSATNAATSEGNAASSASDAATSEANAAASAVEAAAQAAKLRGTSTTAVTVPTAPATIALTTQAGKFFDAGTSLTIVSASDPSALMWGVSTGYAGTALDVQVLQSNNIGANKNDWQITVSGAVGPSGPIAEAPIDGQQYARKNAAWQPFVIPTPPPPLLISDTAPVGAPDNAMWWKSDIGKLFVRYNDGSSVQWVDAVPIPAIDYTNVVKKSGDTMTGALFLHANAPIGVLGNMQAVPRQQLDSTIAAYAAPMDALGMFGMQINGGVSFDQPAGSTAIPITGTNHRFPDGWQISKVGGYALTGQRVVDAPPGYDGSIKLTISTGASPAAGDLVNITHWVEGYRSARLRWGGPSAQPLSFAFWVKANRIGTYTGSVRNNTASHSYVFTYTIDVANTWEWKTFTIQPGFNGVWETTTSTGLIVSFAVSLGTTHMGTPVNTWLGGNFQGAVGQINGAAANTDTFQITGLILIPGLYLPSALQAPYAMRPYAEELQLAQRYYEKSYNIGVVAGTITTGGSVASRNILANNYFHNQRFKQNKRVVPTCQVYSTSTGAGGMLANNTTAADILAAISNIGDDGMTVASAGTAAYGDGIAWHYIADARL